MLPKKGGDIIVFTKSLKDVMVLYEYGITAIAPCSENEFLTDAQYERIKKRFKHYYLLYDLDHAGIQGSKKIKKNHPDLQVLLLPRKYECKDISDFRKKYGDKKTKALIQEALDFYEKRECDD